MLVNPPNSELRVNQPTADSRCCNATGISPIHQLFAWFHFISCPPSLSLAPHHCTALQYTTIIDTTTDNATGDNVGPLIVAVKKGE